MTPAELEAIRAVAYAVDAYANSVDDVRLLLSHVDALDSAATALGNHVQFCEAQLARANELLLRAYRHGIFADGLLGPDIAMFIREIK